MSTEQKKALLADLDSALQAVGRILDGGHDINQLPKVLQDRCLDAMSGIAVMRARLISEIGTDNL